MEFANVGTDVLRREYMNAIIDTEKVIKPAGGLWCTDFIDSKYIPWLDYMLSEPKIFFRKSPIDNPFSQDAVFVKVNKNAKIFQLSGNDQYHLFREQYGLSYERLSEDYDGVYVDLVRCFGDSYEERMTHFNLFSISSLILFNLDVIDSYRRAKLEIEPFDYDYEYECISSYELKMDDKEYKIEPLSSEYLSILEEIYLKFKNFIYFEKSKHSRLSTDQIAYLVYKSILSEYKEELEKYCSKNNLDIRKLSNSLATNAVRKVK